MITNSEDFQKWMRFAQKGDQATYCVGHLVKDRENDQLVDRLGDEVLASAGLQKVKVKGGEFSFTPKPEYVVLTQRRITDMVRGQPPVFEYIATRTSVLYGGEA